MDRILLLLFVLMSSLSVFSQNVETEKINNIPDTLVSNVLTDTPSHPLAKTVDSLLNHPITWKNYRNAASNFIGVNLGVWAFDRYVLNEDFARINCETMRYNLTHAPVWDTDKFATNLLMHPYHGSIYFNGARLNGFNFYQSAPFTLAGSLMWEFFMENEPASINDLIATTVGGSALGEVNFRFSDAILNNSATGFNRFIREFTAGLLSPARFVERLESGKLWKKRAEKGNLERLTPIHIGLNLGYRLNYRKEDFYLKGISLTTDVDYGNIFENDIEKPYDWFQLRFQLDFIKSNTYLSHVNLIGIVHKGDEFENKKVKVNLGLFQHFDYYKSHIKMENGEYITPYYISEVAAAGPGLLFETKGSGIKVNGKLFLNAILLGASKSDYIKIDNRDYNMGSGFSFKFHNQYILSKHWALVFNIEHYFISTWKGASENVEYKDLTKEEWQYLNMQGDKSKARLNVVELNFRYQITPSLYLDINSNHFIRHTKYKYLPKVQYNSFENFLSLGMKL